MPSPLSHLHRVLNSVLDRILLAGGFAVNHHGYSRNTLDLDCICADSDLRALRKLLVANGFSDLVETPVALHAQHPSTGFRIDILAVDPRTFAELFAASVPTSLGKNFPVRVVSLEHLLAMKLHALHQNPDVRRDKDLPDIAWLCLLNQLSPETDLQPLCLQYASADLYTEISRFLQTLQA